MMYYYRINSKTNQEDYDHFMRTFEDLFYNHSILADDNEMRRYSKGWRQPKLFEDLEWLMNDSGTNHVAESLEEYTVKTGDKGSHNLIEYPRPIGPQIEALYELKKCRLDGWDKGIVVAATGIGKTFLAAFDSKKFRKVLFIAHREEILLQAKNTFECVRPGSVLGFFSGERKDSDYDILFATVQTLGREEYLNHNNFAKDEFDYIVIDEFHHAVAESYRNIIGYFKPQFLLGLTATPERLDNQDVFALCDYNIVYEIRLKEAINKGWLTPFRYYGIFDDTDYSHIDYNNSRYNEEQLEKVLNISKRAELILQHYQKYNSVRSLGFCSSRGHAVYMAKFFVDRGVAACAVISRYANANSNESSKNQDTNYIMNRKVAIENLKNRKINVIFSVDMFNEGLDIPEIDTVMFLRPTESPTVFLQQLGRGLRRKSKKKYLNILDFVGNYKKANLIPFFLTGDVSIFSKQTRKVYIPREEDYPEGCYINFDFRLIDLFKRMAEEQKGVSERVVQEYYRIQSEYSIKPLRTTAYTYMDESIYSLIRTRASLNVFKDYLSFLNKINELSRDEKELIGTIAHEFLKTIENTGMTKTYKMPILLAFYNNGQIKLSINDEDICNSFRSFYSNSSNAVDMIKDNSTKNYKNWGKGEYVSLARKNPIKYLMLSSANFFYEENNYFCLSKELEQYINNPAFAIHFKDIIDYRTRKFYKERLEKRIMDVESFKDLQS